MTATPSTYGAKKIVRNVVAARILWFSRIATSSGTTTRNGTLIRTKMPVTLIDFQKSAEVTVAGGEQVDVVLQPDEVLHVAERAPVGQAHPEAEDARYDDEGDEQHQERREEQVGRQGLAARCRPDATRRAGGAAPPRDCAEGRRPGWLFQSPYLAWFDLMIWFALSAASSSAVCGSFLPVSASFSARVICALASRDTRARRSRSGRSRARP